MLWAEVNQEQEKLEIEFYSRPDGQAWSIEYSIAIQSLSEARQRLLNE